MAGRQTSLHIWALIALMMFGVVAGFPLLRIRIDLTSNPALLAAIAAYTAVTIYYAKFRAEPSIVAALISMGQLVLLLVLGVLLTYVAIAIGLPLRDAELQAIDVWLGFDRQRYLAAYHAIPALSALFNAAYLSIQPQTVLVPLVLLLAGQQLRMRQFVLAFGLALLATTVIATLVPAVGAVVYVDLAPHGLSALSADIYTPARTIEALRSGTMSTVRLDDLEGLLAFPSFHTADGILFTWALWRIRWLRIVGLVINTMMIASTPVDGAHYLVDVLAGAMVASAAIAIACRQRSAVRAFQPEAAHA
ncbi:phosphatase PAP2 family protein [Rhodopseudomonas sp. HC1]|nr:phosphatase PAP2 family protein [Rhodopseudomonas infernalis]